MSRKNQHKVRVHKWRNGKLEVEDRFFESLEHAKVFCGTLTDDMAKIYTSNNELVEQIFNPTPVDTYC
jgi:hypothetical protein